MPCGPSGESSRRTKTWNVRRLEGAWMEKRTETCLLASLTISLMRRVDLRHSGEKPGNWVHCKHRIYPNYNKALYNPRVSPMGRLSDSRANFRLKERLYQRNTMSLQCPHVIVAVMYFDLSFLGLFAL